MSEITELRLVLTAEDERNIFGGNDSYIRKIEDSLQVEIIDRNGELHIIGDKEGALKASSIIRELVQLSRRGTAIEEQSVDYAISIKKDKVSFIKASAKFKYDIIIIHLLLNVNIKSDTHKMRRASKIACKLYSTISCLHDNIIT